MRPLHAARIARVGVAAGFNHADQLVIVIELNDHLAIYGGFGVRAEFLHLLRGQVNFLYRQIALSNLLVAFFECSLHLLSMWLSSAKPDLPFATSAATDFSNNARVCRRFLMDL